LTVPLNALHPLHAQAAVVTEAAAMAAAAVMAAVAVVVVVVVVVVAMVVVVTTTVTKISQILLQSRSYNDCHPYISLFFTFCQFFILFLSYYSVISKKFECPSLKFPSSELYSLIFSFLKKF
jgi:hypothetical protein